MPGIENLDGMTAVVTGGGSGIGAGLCRCFSRHGMRVAVSDIDLDSAVMGAEELRETGAGAGGKPGPLIPGVGAGGSYGGIMNPGWSAAVCAR